jgi:hypothetical protein
VEPYFQRELDGVIDQYRQLLGTGKATHNLEDAIAAAYYGRVDKMIVAVDEQVWGTFDVTTGTVEDHAAEQKGERDVALLDAAAMQTLINGGAVYGLPRTEMPVESQVVAIFRY